MPEPLTEADPPAPSRGPLIVWEVGGPGELSTVRTALCERTSEHARQNSGGSRPVLASAAERVGLVFSELATNALRHGRTPVTVTLARASEGWLITVSDARPGEGPVVVERSRGRSGGHGIRLVTQLSRLAGWYRDPELKHVWAEVPDSPPPRLLASLTATHRHPAE